jgi:hypothetical protein
MNKRIKDLTGQRYGKLFVIEFAYSDKKSTYWKCQCDCGDIVIRRGNDMVTGNTSSCGCISGRKNLVGIKFGNLTVIEYAYTDKNRRSKYWKCQCKCGNIIYLDTTRLRSSHTMSCGCLKHRKLEEGLAAINDVFTRYKDGAKLRNYAFDLSKDDFIKITQQNCHYCGCEPYLINNPKSNSGKFVYNGIDRVDNTKGYILDNVVPCCKRCNVAKHNMTYDDFIKLVKQIYNNRIIGG